MTETPVPNPQYSLRDSMTNARQSLRDIPVWAGGTGESLRERDRAVELLRRIMADVDNTNLVYPTDEPDSLLDTRDFLESLT